jgi:hypothetical protein
LYALCTLYNRLVLQKKVRGNTNFLETERKSKRGMHFKTKKNKNQKHNKQE